MNTAAQIEALRAEIRRHDHAYFVESRPLIDDSTYDALVRELRELEAANPQLVTPDSPTQRVGERPLEGFAHVRHDPPMLSVDNTYSPGELREFDARVRRGLDGAAPRYLVDPKVDGVAVSLGYRGGRLERGATRGDGETGDDVTQNLRTIRSVPLALDGAGWPHWLEVRGEVFWPRPQFERFNQKRAAAGEPAFANPRNAASGTLKQLDPRNVAGRGLAFVAHGFGKIDPFPPDVTRHSDLIERLRGWGVPTSPHTRSLGDIEEVIAHVAAWDLTRKSLEYDTDGLVIKVDDLARCRALGFTSKSPRWCIAYKYAAEQAQTRLVAVACQVGKLGTITPVAELAPVFLAGTTVRRASLHNFDQVRRLDVRVGDLVTVEKAGEIIPQVVAVDVSQRPPDATPIDPPTNCPDCQGAVEQDEGGVYLRCVNPGCPTQLVERLRYFCGRDQMDIEGAGAVLVETLVQKAFVKTCADLFRLHARRADLLAIERMGEKSVDNLLAGIEKSKNQPLARLLAALNIRHVGGTTAELLAEHFGDLDALAAADEAALQAVEGIGPEVAASVRRWFGGESGSDLIADLKSLGVNPRQPRRERPSEGPMVGKTVVVTGTLARGSRAEIEELIKKHGGKTSGSVSKKTDYVVAGADAGGKLEKAQALGVKVLSEEEFERLIGTT